MWSSGDPVLVRRLLGKRIWYAASLIAVRADPDALILWQPREAAHARFDRGLISPEEASAARAEGERVLHEWPFPTGWEDWRPPSEWTPPPLPEGWDVV